MVSHEKMAWHVAKAGVPADDILIDDMLFEGEAIVVASPSDLGVFLIKEDRHVVDHASGQSVLEEIGMCVFDDARMMRVLKWRRASPDG